ncbi:acetyl-CoA carboxylase biotin carboxyl carrier protein subunit [Micromonospora sp. RHAY321]|nr:biotin/lipoyl-containing protein [Micromonospora sp. RHAY321]MCO1594959.1 acetyl-CoA carboxylase biotin carboxyl carrier protein subunit [Micromonospora sp. RHAY321]
MEDPADDAAPAAGSPGADRRPAGHDGACLHADPGDGVRPGAGHPAEGSRPDDAGARDEEVLAGLRRQARQLVAELTGPVRRIRLRSGPAVLEVEWHPGEAARPDVPPAPPPDGEAPASPAATVPGPPAALIRPPVPGHAAVRAPIVGTFYRAPEPGAAPFVAVGDLVRPGQPVAIVEAMKLMNEVVADRAGRVVAILVDDGQPVEYDQPLVELDPA